MIKLFSFSLRKVLANIAVSLISEKFLEWALFRIAGRIVKSTQTPHDDVWLDKVKDTYYSPKE